VGGCLLAIVGWWGVAGGGGAAAAPGEGAAGEEQGDNIVTLRMSGTSTWEETYSERGTFEGLPQSDERKDKIVTHLQVVARYRYKPYAGDHDGEAEADLEPLKIVGIITGDGGGSTRKVDVKEMGWYKPGRTGDPKGFVSCVRQIVDRETWINEVPTNWDFTSFSPHVRLGAGTYDINVMFPYPRAVERVGSGKHTQPRLWYSDPKVAVNWDWEIKEERSYMDQSDSATIEEELKKKLKGKFKPGAKGFEDGGEGTYSWQKELADKNSKFTWRGTVNVHYTLTFGKGADVEAEMIPEEGYELWMPEADWAEDKPGNTMKVQIRLHKKGEPKVAAKQRAKFKVELLEVSREKGICLNSPAKEKAKDTPDMKLEQSENGGWTVAKDGLSATSDDAAEVTAITVTSFDWGAYARLRVTATLESDGTSVVAYRTGKPEEKTLTIPLDENKNHIADCWEKSYGIFGENRKADWNGSELPKDQWCPGDGISLYEKYRGFSCMDRGDPQRLDPRQKYLFIYDEKNLFGKHAGTISLAQASGLRLLFVDDEGWTGKGSSGAKKRIVNFNGDWGHKVDQHAVWITTDGTDDFAFPKGYEDLLKAHGIQPGRPEGSTFGITLPEGSVENGPPVNVYQVTMFPLVMKIRIRERALRAMYMLPEFAAARALATGDADKDAAEREKHRKELDKLVDDYEAAHKGEKVEAYEKMMGLVVTHEMGHSVAVRHHEDQWSGNRSCVMRYMQDADAPLDASDPYQVRRYVPWPGVFCRDKGHTAGGLGCFKQILVTDSHPEGH
jgi:hypothetical protein